MSNAPLVHLSDLQKRLRVFAVWEKVRNDGKVHWAIECFAEMASSAYINATFAADTLFTQFGVFLYVYFGMLVSRWAGPLKAKISLLSPV